MPFSIGRDGSGATIKSSVFLRTYFGRIYCLTNNFLGTYSSSSVISRPISRYPVRSIAGKRIFSSLGRAAGKAVLPGWLGILKAAFLRV
jgi:hypothetical protein